MISSSSSIHFNFSISSTITKFLIRKYWTKKTTILRFSKPKKMLYDTSIHTPITYTCNMLLFTNQIMPIVKLSNEANLGIQMTIQSNHTTIYRYIQVIDCTFEILKLTFLQNVGDLSGIHEMKKKNN